MSCQHTICSGCISNIKRNKCPICNEIIRNKQVNQAILQRAPESHYDKLKNGYLNLYTKINDMKYSLNEKRNVNQSGTMNDQKSWTHKKLSSQNAATSDRRSDRYLYHT